MTSQTDMNNKKDEQQPQSGDHSHNSSMDRKQLATLSLAALGVVFGDIGTSPLYAVRECFNGVTGVEATPLNIMGIISLILWSLIMIVTVKYLTFILRADRQGEGGELVLTSLVSSMVTKKNGKRWVLISLGVFGASMMYGDGMITPAISVLSAVEGLKTVAPGLQPYVLPATITILTLLFLMQSRGTASIGRVFGPVIALWLIVVGSFGFMSMIKNPEILKALSPYYGIRFLIFNKIHGFLAMGAVFLCVTGAEALYTDLGHFGKKPIRLVWLCFAMPMLMLNYFGQGAFLLAHPSETFHPFYGLVPRWFAVPMIALATMATVIASQAVISGAFSITRQAMQYGYLPRMRILHTSNQRIGQIYVPAINWFLMIACIGLVLGFKTSSKLAAAYGVAVTGTMMISSTLFYRVARDRFGWSRLFTATLVGVFLIVDFTFFAANMTKIIHGAWFPLMIGGIVFLLMSTWKRGREVLSKELKTRSITFEDFMKSIHENPPQRVERQAIFMTGNPDIVPPALLRNLSANKTLHSHVTILNFSSQDSPRVSDDEKISIEDMGEGIYRVHVIHGYMESPSIKKILELVLARGLELNLSKTTFFLGRERLIPGGGTMKPRMASLFSFMSRNAQDATAYYDIPPDQVMEVGVQLKI